MKYILDTATFLWWTSGKTNAVSPTACLALESKEGSFYLSTVSIWEIAIKHSIGKLGMTLHPIEMLSELRKTGKIFLLPIEPEHAASIADLPFHHRDPFDRLLIAQSKIEDIPIITPDAVFKKYGIETIW